MEVEGLEEPDSKSWYVFGRIAEQFGLREAALAAYRRLEPRGEEEALPASTYRLAQRRLAALRAGRG